MGDAEANRSAHPTAAPQSLEAPHPFDVAATHGAAMAHDNPSGSSQLGPAASLGGRRMGHRPMEAQTALARARTREGAVLLTKGRNANAVCKRLQMRSLYAEADWGAIAVCMRPEGEAAP